MIDGILIYPLLTAALYYLGARAAITSFIWSHYPPRFDAFMQCAACAGTWYGFACGLIGQATDTPFLGSHAWWTTAVIGAAAMVWTPIVANKMEHALRELHGDLPAMRVVTDGGTYQGHDDYDDNDDPANDAEVINVALINRDDEPS